MLLTDFIRKKAQRLRLILDARGRGGVKAEQLYYICGLKRSGLHAISNWIMGQVPNHAFINNSPIKLPGEGSRMSRTSQTSPLPVRVRRGDKTVELRDGTEKFRRLPARANLLIVLFQSQHLWHLTSHQPLVAGVVPRSIRWLLILRDPFNWAASYMEKSEHPDAVNIWPRQWLEYAREFTGITQYLPEPLRINYNQWFSSPVYRQTIAEQLGFNFTDNALEVVTNHAGGSSFDKQKFNGNAQQMKIMDRWKLYRDNPAYAESLRQNPEILDLAEQVFDLQPELTAFAKTCR